MQLTNPFINFEVASQVIFKDSRKLVLSLGCLHVGEFWRGGRTNQYVFPSSYQRDSISYIDIKQVQDQETEEERGIKISVAMCLMLKTWRKTTNHWQFQVVGKNFFIVAGYEGKTLFKI